MQEQLRNSNINEGIKKYQDQKRNNTVMAIEEAINTLNDLGKKVTAAKLVELTGLHRTTLYKPNIREIWDENIKGKSVSIEPKNLTNKELINQLETLMRINEKLNDRYLKALGIKEELGEKNKQLHEDLKQEKRKNEILRGQILNLQLENNIFKGR